MKIYERLIMEKGCSRLSAESGFVLITALIIMLILTIIGIAATNTSIFEIQISGNDRVHKETFTQADAGISLNERLTFENAVCNAVSSGFKNDNLDVGTFIRVIDKDFAKPGTAPSISAAYYPDGVIGNGRHTDLSGTGEVKTTPGSALQMVAGYEGLGAGAAGGGTHVLYDLWSEHVGNNANSRSKILSQWQLSMHLINSASSYDCKY
jgi:Tfp pilus assembly protein PilX